MRVQDTGPADAQVLEFGPNDDEMDQSGKRISTLFTDKSLNTKGVIEVIAHPFYEGSHVCSHIDQAIAVAIDLKNLHDAGFVHGDIRGLNVVFGSASCLIDFDFGGKVIQNRQ